MTKVEEPAERRAEGGQEEGCGKEGGRQKKKAAAKKPAAATKKKAGKKAWKGLRGKVWDRKSILTDSGWE